MAEVLGTWAGLDRRVGAVRRWLLDKPEMEPEALAKVRARLERVLATLVADGRVWIERPRVVDDLRALLAEIDRRAALPRKSGHAPALGRMPGGPGRDLLSPALAAAQALAGLGTVRVSGRASTLTSAERPQLAHDAVTMRTPFWRMLASVIGGPGLLRMVPVAHQELTHKRRWAAHQLFPGRDGVPQYSSRRGCSSPTG